MSRSIHFMSNTIPGYGTPDGIYLPHPHSGASRRAVGISLNSSRGDYTLVSHVKFLSLRSGPRHTSSICNSNSSSYRRNPDFPRQNRNGFSRNRNRHNEEIDNGHEDLEGSEALTSKNGPLLSISGNQKFRATTTPGPREKEIVELFRKVQAQLRERAAMKEEMKGEDSQGKSKETETVDSLLKLLRKHSVQQGKKNTNNSASNRDFILDPEQSIEESSSSISDSSSAVKHEMQESQRAVLIRPKSNFRKRSPVPEIKFQPVYSEGLDNSVDNLDSRKGMSLETESDDMRENKTESVVEQLFVEGNVFEEMSEDETSEIYESESENGEDEDSFVEASDLSGMKLVELKALAKSRGLKGFSKLKKSELVQLLSESSI